MTAYAFVSYGLGGSAFDPAGGEVVLCQKIKALGVDIGESPYLYSDTQKIADAILATPHGSVIILGGDSLGANNAPFIAASIRTKRGIDYLFGFQPSLWGYHSTVPKSVVEALCIYNPNWFATFGLGDYPWPLEAGNTRTKLRYIETSDAHPGDNDPAMQAIIVADIKRIIGADKTLVLQPTQAQFVAAFRAAKSGIADMVNSFGLPGWEAHMVEQYVTDERVNVLSDSVAKAVVNAGAKP